MYIAERSWTSKVHESDSSDHAVELLRRTALAEGIHALAERPVLHGDNGATVKAHDVGYVALARNQAIVLAPPSQRRQCVHRVLLPPPIPAAVPEHGFRRPQCRQSIGFGRITQEATMLTRTDLLEELQGRQRRGPRGSATLERQTRPQSRRYRPDLTFDSDRLPGSPVSASLTWKLLLQRIVRAAHGTAFHQDPAGKPSSSEARLHVSCQRSFGGRSSHSRIVIHEHGDGSHVYWNRFIM